MLFNSLEFLLFFPVVTLLYFFCAHQYRWLLLLLASCIFYCAFIPYYILILFFTIVIDYVAGIMIENAEGKKKKRYLIISIVANVGVLAVFKYYNFFIDNINDLLAVSNISSAPVPYLNIILPVGLSFHTFQAMSYTIEVYRGNYKAERHFGIYSLYVMFFPQLVAGPIERPQNVLPQFHEKKFFNTELVKSGLQLMLWGFIKKVVIADRLALFTDPVFNDPSAHSSINIVVAIFFFSFQIFCDFSGYSDIAIGSARVMGFKLMKNFDKPYQSKTIAEFWKRWHISLSTWFRDYLYISLGGNRVSVPRWFFNLFIVFLISGFWHGANWTFVLWGALHGIYLIVGIITAPLQNKISIAAARSGLSLLFNWWQVLTTFLLVTLSWVFFRAATVTEAFYMLKRVPAGIKDGLNAIKNNAIFANTFPVTKQDLLISVTAIFLLEVVHYTSNKKNIPIIIDVQPRYLRWSFYYSLLFIIISFGVFNSNSFIYFQF